MTDVVQAWANGSTNNGIRLAAVNENSSNTWRRYRSAEYTDYDGNFRPKLTVTYNHYPAAATGVTASPLDETDTTITRTPVVSARADDADGDQVQLLIRAYAAADSTSQKLGECTTALGAANVDLACTMSQLPNNQAVYLRAKAVDKYSAWAGRTSSATSGWSAWRTINVAQPVVSTPVVDQIVALTPGSTVEEVTATIEQMVIDAAADPVEPVTLTFSEVADAMLTDLTQDIADVNADNAEGQAVVDGEAAPEPVEIVDTSTDDVVETVPEGAVEPTETELRTLTMRTYSAAAASGDSGSVNASDEYIHLPRARRYGDIVVSPNKGAYGFPHGHAAIFTSYNWIAQAPGGNRHVEVVHRLDRYGQSFVPGSKMMSVYTDEGDGPLLSYEKREKAVNWAKGRQGDKYRSATSKNAFRVTAAVGSDDVRQNCSQLVYGAYNYANGYKFNPVEWQSKLNAASWYQDANYVWPSELTDAKQTKVYRWVYTDSTS